MKIIQTEQYSPEYWEVRRGIPTASNFDRIITTEGKPSKQAEKYLYQLACARVSKNTEDTFQSAAMLRGLEMEAEARNVFNAIMGVETEQIGFCIYEGEDAISAGCSPDSIYPDHTQGLECKAPEAYGMIGYILNPESLVRSYYQQIQGSIFVTGAKSWNICAYYPGLKPVIVNVKPDEAFQNALRIELRKFCSDLETIVNKIK